MRSCTGSKEILKLNKELIERSTEFANNTEKLSVEAKEKDRKINSLTWLNEALEQDKKEMDAKNAELERVRSIAISSIGECTKTLDENLKLKNQQIESSTTEHGQQNAKEKSRNGNVQKGQTKVQKPDAESCMGTVSKITNPSLSFNSAFSIFKALFSAFRLSFSLSSLSIFASNFSIFCCKFLQSSKRVTILTHFCSMIIFLDHLVYLILPLR